MSAHTLMVTAVEGHRIDVTAQNDLLPRSVLGTVRVTATDGSTTLQFQTFLTTDPVPTVGDRYIVVFDRATEAE